MCIRAMSTELFLNFLGIRMDSRKAEGMRFTINLVTPDNGENHSCRARECHAHEHRGVPGQQAGPDAHHQSLRPGADDDARAKTLEAQIADGTAKVQGDATILRQLASTFVVFDPRFEIMPGTSAGERKDGPAPRTRLPYRTRLRGDPAPDDRRVAVRTGRVAARRRACRLWARKQLQVAVPPTPLLFPLRCCSSCPLTAPTPAASPAACERRCRVHRASRRAIVRTHRQLSITGTRSGNSGWCPC